jgi:hypothetical protein
MDHRLMGLAKAIIAELIDKDDLPEINTCEILSSRLPSPYSGRSVEARQWLIQEGFIKRTRSSNIDRITKESIKYVKSAGDDYLKTAKMMLDKGIDNLDGFTSPITIDEELWDNPQKNRKSIEANITRKRSYGKKRSTQVKVSMSDEEVLLIDWLGKLGYGNEGSRSATLRQAIADIAKLANEIDIYNINNLAGEILRMIELSRNMPSDINSDINPESEPHPKGASDGKIDFYVIEEKEEVKSSIKAAIDSNNLSFIFCQQNESSDVIQKIDTLIEGVSIAYNGEVTKSEQGFSLYILNPQNRLLK